MNLHTALFMMPGLLIGLTVHEFAHAWVASLLGDNFARRQGRVSLNPFRHLTVLGTLAIFLLPMGWARPVPVNLYNFKHPRRDYLLVSLAGPAANLLLVGLCLLALLATRRIHSCGPAGEPFLLLCDLLLRMFVIINTVLAAVNLLPIPPLDGSKIWLCLLPRMDPAVERKLMRVSWIVLMVLLFNGSLGPVLRFALDGALAWMPTREASTFDNHLANARQAQKNARYVEAELLYTRAIDIDRRSWRAWAWRAETRMFLKRFPEALADYDQAIRIEPENASMFVSRARIEEYLGMHDRAIADFAQAMLLGHKSDEILPEVLHLPTSQPVLSPVSPVP